MAKPDDNVVGGMIWMLVIALLLFWAPVIGPLIAGFVGGKKAGGVGPAIMAAFLPCILLGIALFVLGTALTGIPILGLLAGAVGVFVTAAAVIGPLLLGAVIGGLMVDK